MKALVTYFSASGVTRSVAQSLAAAINAPIYEIRPEVPYTDEDLVGRIVNFGSAAMLKSTWKKVKAEADKKGIAMDEREFHCKGEFKGIHKGRPNEEDLEKAAEFAREILKQ